MRNFQKSILQNKWQKYKSEKELVIFSGYTREYKGEKLYKYYSFDCCPDKMFAPIINKTLRYRTPMSFNDPYDCYIAANLNQSITSVRETEMKEVLVCSLTETDNDILMWSHYASSHKGFVVEYDMKKLNEINERQIEIFSHVEYSDSIVYRSFSAQDSDKDIVQAIYHKSLCWEYEKEVRSVVYGSPDSIGGEYKDVQLPEESISAVILGSYFMSETKGNIPSILKPWYEGYKLHYMQLQADKYKLERKKDFKEEWFSET
ncbi:MAG: DUF2971 domain-containing protein [Treponema sp.]|nr:DUF2971 domain-containing protein [Treponema sp.]